MIPEYILTSVRNFGPETALVIAFCLAILADLVRKTPKKLGAWIALAGIAASAYLVTKQTGMGELSIFSNMYAIDALSLFFKFLILGTSAFIVIFSMQLDELMIGRRALGEYFALLTALTLGMMLMTGSTNLLMMYLSLELTSMSSYILSGYIKDADDSSEASLKYVIYGALSSGMMLYGISILYGLTGSIDIYGINTAFMSGHAHGIALIIAGILTLVGFGYKISAVPFHF
jgi:NADH-quinone oxidoreductase subunit N